MKDLLRFASAVCPARGSLKPLFGRAVGGRAPVLHAQHGQVVELLRVPHEGVHMPADVLQDRLG